MASRTKRFILFPFYLTPDKITLFGGRLRLINLIKELGGDLTDKFVELLLKGMDLAFCLSIGYRKNIKNFEGKYLFRTEDEAVVASAIFKNGNMKVCEEAIYDWDVRVTFKDVGAFWSFLFSRDQDILESLLNNDVETDGNLNYMYKFVFMVKDLARRLGIG